MRFAVYLAAALVALTANAIDLESQNQSQSTSQETDWTKKVKPLTNDKGFLWREDPKGSGKWRKFDQPTAAAKPLEEHPSHVQEMIAWWEARIAA